jgi:hypothetical protein
MRQIAQIDPANQKQGMKVLVLEDDSKTGGYFIYHHTSLEESYTFDDWFETVEQAREFAFDNYGITKSDWADARE